MMGLSAGDGEIRKDYGFHRDRDDSYYSQLHTDL